MQPSMKIFRYCNGPVHWGSKAQQAQALSSAGAELTVLTEATGDGIAIREAAYELNLPQREPMKMFTDNRAAVFIGEDAAAVRKSKADSRHAIFLQETVEEGIMELKHWPGKGNVADIGTKWLNRHDFEKYRAVLINMHAHRKLSIPVP